MNGKEYSRNLGAIRITYEDVNDQHVDDLLQRQASLRNESGITRQGKGKWYLHNWFLFMNTGFIAAFLAWALIEPFFDDNLYIQGTLERSNDGDHPWSELSTTLSKNNISFTPTLHMRINGEGFWVTDSTKVLNSQNKEIEADLEELLTGQPIGAYIATEPLGVGLSVANYIIIDPNPNPPRKASLSLQQLKKRTDMMGLLFFAITASFIGLAIGMTEGFVCRVYRRVLIGGAVGFLAGFIGGFFSGLIADIIYIPLTDLAMNETGDAISGLSTSGFIIQMGGRSLAWCMAGMTMGLGQGLSLRSGRLLLYGFLGGIIGGLTGGLVFDPIDMVILDGVNNPSAHWSRLIGIVVIGGTVGGMIGAVELLARDAWLRMTEGPLAGKEFLIFKDLMVLGSSPRSDIYLFNDDKVAERHATIRCSGDIYEIEAISQQTPVSVNGRNVTNSRLRDGDQLGIGRTLFTFQKRKG